MAVVIAGSPSRGRGSGQGRGRGRGRTRCGKPDDWQRRMKSVKSVVTGGEVKVARGDRDH